MPGVTPSQLRSLLLAVGGVAVLAALIAWVSSIGGPHGPEAGLVSVVYLLLVAGPPVLAYLLAAFGLGTLLRRWTKDSKNSAALECGLGLAFMLSVSHGLGVIGLLGGAIGRWVGAGVVLVGIVLLARRVLEHIRRVGGVIPGSVPVAALLALPAIAVLITAACNPPGWLWDSEARGYDALSYHLQLPQEWIESGRIQPSDHNVYSYLPSYMEAAYTHIGILTGAPSLGRGLSRPMGLLDAEGHGVITCQLLHAALAVLSAVLVGRWVATTLACGRTVGAISGALFLSVPWVVVTGSLAYNEMGVTALFAAALIAAGDSALRNRGLLCGLLVGVACGCKPTAIFLCAPVAGFVLLCRRDGGWPVRLRHVGLAAAGGLVAIVPWLIRNGAACGNPIFPMGTGLFGHGHWSAEQVQRYIAGHSFDGGLFDRVKTLFDAGGAGEPPRGLLHSQWAILPAVACVGWVVALIKRSTHMAAFVLGVGIVTQLAAWLFLTHLQSRFLLPLAVTGCGVVGLGLAALRRLESAGEVDERRARLNSFVVGIGALVCIGHAGLLIGIFKAQSGGQPNLTLLQSPWYRSGELDRRVLNQEPHRAEELAKVASPEIFVNVLAQAGTKVYLIGEARGLYYTCPILYNTTWDKWPLGEAMRRAPGKPAEWTRDLWNQGVRLVMFNEAEVDRLQTSGKGWADPLVSSEVVAAWLKEEGLLVRSWPEAGVALFELKMPGAAR